MGLHLFPRGREYCGEYPRGLDILCGYPPLRICMHEPSQQKQRQVRRSTLEGSKTDFERSHERTVLQSNMKSNGHG